MRAWNHWQASRTIHSRHNTRAERPCGGQGLGRLRKDPNLPGVSGRRVVLRIPKQFGRIEGWFANLLRAPREIRRPLDQMNSLLWELSDGSRTFGEICGVMDEVFREEIAPVMQRTAAAIGLFQRNNLALMLDEPLNRRWTVGPGQTPEHQTLAGLSDDLDYDSHRWMEMPLDLRSADCRVVTRQGETKPVAFFIPVCKKTSTAPR